MKKLITIVTAISAATAVNAQDHFTSEFRPEVFRVIATIFVVALFMLFILTIMKRIFEYRLKNKIVDKGIPENVASSILQTKSGEERHINIKWFALLAGIGAGLTIIYYTLPLGIHSLAIMAFSISLSFLGYFFYLKQSGN
jgi:hypothetical protein